MCLCTLYTGRPHLTLCLLLTLQITYCDMPGLELQHVCSRVCVTHLDFAHISMLVLGVGRFRVCFARPPSSAAGLDSRVAAGLGRC